ELAAYRMEIRDLLVAQRVGDDQYIGVNAGKTRHQGIELSANYHKRFTRWFTVDPFVAISVGDYTFLEFNTNGNDFSGNELTGVPSNKVNAGISVGSDSGLYFTGDFQYVDAYPMNDSNTAYNEAYRVWNFKAGYRFNIFKNFASHLAVGVNNAGNEHYAAMVLVNATGFGNAAPRYYYPGVAVHYYANLSFNYSL